MQVHFNFRFSTESTEIQLQKKTEAILRHSIDDFSIDWQLSGLPFLTEDGVLIPIVKQILKEYLDLETELSTSGGTSDGRFIAPRGVEVVELGPCNATIHKVNEQIPIAELHQLSALYQKIMESLLTDA